MTTLTAHLQSRLDRELDAGEEARWVAQPYDARPPKPRPRFSE